MYDFANSSYTTLISTVAFSVYFRQVVVGADDNRGDLLWSLGQVASHLVLILTAPIMGAAADYSGRKKAFLLATTIQTVVACAMLGLVGPGAVGLGLLLYVIGTVGFEGGYVFYNAFLPEVSTPKNIGRISGWSWGTGFLGGLVALVACGPLLSGNLLDAAGDPVPETVFGYRLSFVVVAAFFALFSVPTFLFLRERPVEASLRSMGDYVRVGFRRVGQTLTRLRSYRDVAVFVVAALFFSGGIETVIKFSAIYATVTFGMSGKELALLFIFTNLIAFPGTLASGYLADRIGGRRALAATLVMWSILVVVGALAQTRPAFWVMAAGIAIGMGSTQAIGRSFMAQISPANRESEFFGFYLLCNKIGSILGVTVFGAMSVATGNQRMAVLATLPFFLLGLGLLLRIDQARAFAAAAAPTEGSPR